MYKPYLVGGQGSTAGGYHVFNTFLVQLYHIGIALYEVAVISLSNCLFGKENTIQHFALVINITLGRVEVFSLFLIVSKDTPPKAEHTPAHRVYGEHHPAFEAVELAVAINNRKSRFL